MPSEKKVHNGSERQVAAGLAPHRDGLRARKKCGHNADTVFDADLQCAYIKLNYGLHWCNYILMNYRALSATR